MMQGSEAYSWVADFEPHLSYAKSACEDPTVQVGSFSNHMSHAFIPISLENLKLDPTTNLSLQHKGNTGMGTNYPVIVDWTNCQGPNQGRITALPFRPLASHVISNMTAVAKTVIVTQSATPQTRDPNIMGPLTTACNHRGCVPCSAKFVGLALYKCVEHFCGTTPNSCHRLSCGGGTYGISTSSTQIVVKEANAGFILVRLELRKTVRKQ